MRKAIFFLLMFFMGSILMAYTAEKYISDVKSGKVVACKWVKLAVDRHVNDLKRIGKKGFPYHFEAEYAKNAIDFIQLLEHTKGEFANRSLHDDIRIKLEPWQQFIIWAVEGWRNKDGFRRFTRAYIEVRRNKTRINSKLNARPASVRGY